MAQGKGAVIWGSAGAGHTCWDQGKVSSQGTVGEGQQDPEYMKPTDNPQMVYSHVHLPSVGLL